jgi:hypothetical protein
MPHIEMNLAPTSQDMPEIALARYARLSRRPTRTKMK